MFIEKKRLGTMTMRDVTIAKKGNRAKNILGFSQVSMLV